MDTATPIGEVFTPRRWAKWLIHRWNIFEAWIEGAEICDPTAGDGAFPLALLAIARERGMPLTAARLSRLTLIERNASHLSRFRENVRQEFGVDFPVSRLHCQDVILTPPAGTYDILVGNPPWSNFGDLPATYKCRVKPLFLKEGLAPAPRDLLLGASRTDIAALVLKTVLGRLLKRNGKAYFYLPLSLLFGEGAHTGFRDYRAHQRHFAVETVYEFTTTRVFAGISTAYGCAKFRCDTPQTFPVPYFREADGGWLEHKAVPLKDSADPWRVLRTLNELNREIPPDLELSTAEMPRQGVNTCGANDVFIFQEKPAHLPDAFLYPLATKEIWRHGTAHPQKWVLLPYNQETGKPLTPHEIERHPDLKAYLQSVETRLRARKGTLLRSTMKSGYWWGMLGVGTYAFAPFKVMWEAYGRSQLNPIVLSHVDGQAWQGNQAMHAFIPCGTAAAAAKIKKGLEHPDLSRLLRELNGAGKRNWAQPGKMKKLLSLKNANT